MSEPQQPANPQQQPYPPQQHPTQPGQPYGAPGQPYGADAPPYARSAAGAAPASGAAATGNSLGTVALLVSAVAVGIGLVFRVLSQFLYASVGFDVVEILSNVLSFVVFLGSAAGLVLGLMALRRPAPHLLAAIAVGVAGSAVASTLAGALSGVFYSLGF
nr:hypothetical protein [uncultured Microbacterium sp.]